LFLLVLCIKEELGCGYIFFIESQVLHYLDILLLHIISTALILAGPEIYEGAEAIYKNFYFRLGEVG
jgi:hypothetical protein